MGIVMPFDSMGVIVVQVLVLRVGLIGLGLVRTILVVDAPVVVVVAALDGVEKQ